MVEPVVVLHFSTSIWLHLHQPLDDLLVLDLHQNLSSRDVERYVSLEPPRTSRSSTASPIYSGLLACLVQVILSPLILLFIASLLLSLLYHASIELIYFPAWAKSIV